MSNVSPFISNPNGALGEDADTPAYYNSDTHALVGGSGGGVTWSVVNKTAGPYTAQNGEIVQVDASGGPVTITVPRTSGQIVAVQKMDSSSNPVTIVPSSGVIDGVSGLLLTLQYQSRMTVGGGTNVTSISMMEPKAVANGLATLGNDGFIDDAQVAPLSVADITDTGILPEQLGAIPQTGGAPEGIAIDSDISGDYTPDLTRGNYFVLSLNGDMNLVMPTVDDGQLYGFSVHIFSNGFTTTWDIDNETITWKARVEPTLDTSTDDLLSFICEGVDGTWLGLHHDALFAVGNNSVRWKVTNAPAPPPSGEIEQWFDATLNKFLWMGSDEVIHEIGATEVVTTGVISQVPGQSVTGKDFAAAGTFSLALTGTPTSGNMLSMVIQMDYIGTVTATGWTKDAELVGSFGRVGIYSRISTGIVGDKTATVTFTGSKYIQMWFAEFTGNTASPLDKTNTGSDTDTTLDVVTAATTQASEFAIFAYYTTAATNVVSYGTSGFGTVYDGGLGAVATKPLTVIGAVTGSITVNTNPIEILGAVATYKAA